MVNQPSDTKHPGISFIVTCFNCADTLNDTVRSILWGNLERDDEIILVDDASFDHTPKLIEKFKDSFPCVRSIRHSLNKSSASAARNTGIDEARHELVFCLDAGNILVPGSIAKLKQHLIRENADCAAFQEARYINSTDGIRCTTWRYKRGTITLVDALCGLVWPGTGGNYLFTKSAWCRANRQTEHIDGNLSSWAFGIRQLGCGAKMVTLPEHHYYHRTLHSFVFQSACKERNPSLVGLSVLLDFLDQLHPDDVEMIFTVGRYNWFDNLSSRPIRTSDGRTGTPGKILDVPNNNQQRIQNEVDFQLTSFGAGRPNSISAGDWYLRHIRSITDLSALEPYKLHLGCGEVKLQGYVNIDYPPSEHTLQQKIAADIFWDITKLSFPSGSIGEVRLHHVFEHFNFADALALLARWHQWLIPGGRLTIETPDVEGSSKLIADPSVSYRDKQVAIRHLYGSHEAHWAVHKDGWYADKYLKVLGAMGFASINVSLGSWLATRNITVHATKMRELTRDDLQEAAVMLLRDNMVDNSMSEQKLWAIWCKAYDCRLG